MSGGQDAPDPLTDLGQPVIVVHLEDPAGSGRAVCSGRGLRRAPNYAWPDVPRQLCAGCHNITRRLRSPDPHYMRALDEVWRLRALAAYEVKAIDEHLVYRRTPKALRQRLEQQRDRLKGAARGRSQVVITGLRSLMMSGSSSVKQELQRVTGKQTLTRAEWEAEA